MPRFFANGLRLSAVVLAAVAWSTMPVCAQSPASQRATAAVLTVEHEWLTALQRRDVATLARILGAEFIDSDFQGDAITRAQYLAYFTRPIVHPEPRVRQTFSDTKVRFVAGGSVAIATGVVSTRVAATSNAGASSNPNVARYSRFTDVLVWRAARWQAVTSQETHFVPAAG